MFQAWRLLAKFTSMHRHKLFRKQGRVHRKELWMTKLREAEQAAAHANTRALFAVARSLAPRRDPRPVQLRGSEGQLLSPEKELRLLKDFCCDLFDFAACSSGSFQAFLHKHSCNSPLQAQQLSIQSQQSTVWFRLATLREL